MIITTAGGEKELICSPAEPAGLPGAGTSGPVLPSVTSRCGSFDLKGVFVARNGKILCIYGDSHSPVVEDGSVGLEGTSGRGGRGLSHLKGRECEWVGRGGRVGRGFLSVQDPNVNGDWEALLDGVGGGTLVCERQGSGAGGGL